MWCCNWHAGTPCFGGLPHARFWLRSDSQSSAQVHNAAGFVCAGQPNRPHVLVKTHRWSDDWDPLTADLVFLTHRDLRAVLASYQRVGWTFHIPDSYVAEHMQWRVRHGCVGNRHAHCSVAHTGCLWETLRGSACCVRFLQGCADHDFAYEDILGKPHEQMKVLASLLGVEDQARL